MPPRLGFACSPALDLQQRHVDARHTQRVVGRVAAVARRAYGEARQRDFFFGDSGRLRRRAEGREASAAQCDF